MVDGLFWRFINLCIFPRLKDHYFFLGGGGGDCDFQEAENFFYHRLSTCKFFPSTHCADNFLKIPQISYNRGGPCRQFFQMHLWCRQFISAIFLIQTIFFPNRDTSLGKNNGPSLTIGYENFVVVPDSSRPDFNFISLGNM